jgi:hypothetical protein
MAQQGSAGVFGITGDREGSVRGEPIEEFPGQLVSQFGAFPVLLLGAPFLGSVEPEQDGNGHPALCIPGQWDPEGHDNPVMSEGKRLGLGWIGGPSGIGGTTRIVVHGRTEEMGAGLLAQGVVNNGNDVSGKQTEQKLKNDMAHGIATPSAVGQETVQACMVSLGSRCCLNDTADAVAALAGNPSEGQGDKALVAGFGETGSEREQEGMHAKGYGERIHHGNSS